MIELKNVSKTFDSGTGEVDALKNVTLTINDGDIYGIIGMSGAGKSTLVRCINLLEKPSSGEIIVNGERLDTMSPAQLRAARRNITMIFQHFNLLMQRTCLKNICFPMELAGVKKAEAEKRARELLELVGLPDKANAYPAQLSGGQQQRIAIARALATDPKVLLCDEATSALDPQTTHSILALLKRLNRELGLTIVVITHQMNVVKEICDHVAVMESGRVIESGDVFSVFSTPQHDLTREFIASTSSLTRVHELVAEDSPVVALKPGEVLVRLNYLTRDINEPIISSISRTFDIDVNIIFADVEIVNGSPIGGTVAKLSGPRPKIDAALDYLPDNENVRVEVIADAR